MSHTRLFCDFLSTKGFLSGAFEYICCGHFNYVDDKHLNKGSGCFFLITGDVFEDAFDFFSLNFIDHRLSPFI